MQLRRVTEAELGYHGYSVADTKLSRMYFFPRIETDVLANWTLGIGKGIIPGVFF